MNSPLAMPKPPPLPRLHVVTDVTLQRRWSHLDLARAAVAGRADAVQFRDKRTDAAARLESAALVVRESRRLGGRIAVIINDDPEMAASTAADGVHLGPEDATPSEARKLVGERSWIGFSAASVAEARWAEEEGADYLGVGAVYGSHSKSDAGAAIGVGLLTDIVVATRLPVIAIGSITADRVAEVMASGAHGVAVLSAVCLAEDPAAATLAIARALDAALHSRGEIWRHPLGFPEPDG